MEDLSLILRYCSVYSVLLPLIVGYSRIRKLNNAFIPIIILISVSFSFDLLSWLSINYNLSTINLVTVYGFVEALLLFWFASTVNVKPIRFWTVLPLYCLTLALYLVLFGYEPIPFFGISRTFEGIAFFILVLLYLHNLYKTDDDIFIERNPTFWIFIAFFVYFSGAFYTFLLSSKILASSNDSFFNSWILHNFSNTIKNVLLALGLWRGTR